MNGVDVCLARLHEGARCSDHRVAGPYRLHYQIRVDA
jgi:hypothetical protein